MIKIPTGNTIDDIKCRSKIISDFYRKWCSLHPDKKTVKLMVGIKKKSKEKVQYCITAIST